jgi:hypothetical protein
MNEALVERLTHLSRPTPAAPRQRAYDVAMARATATMTEFRRLKRFHTTLVSDLARLDQRALLARIPLALAPLVGTLLASARTVQAMLDGELIDLRDATRAAWTALVGPEANHVSTLQQVEKFTKLAEDTASAITTQMSGITKLLAKLEGVELEADTTPIPPPANQPFIPSRS